MTKDLFIKYLQGNCSETEFEQICVWLKEGSSTNPGREMVQEVWNEFEPETMVAKSTKYNRILDKIHHQININENSTRLKVRRMPASLRILPIIMRAAAILLIPVLTILVYTLLSDRNQYAKNINELEIEAPAGSKMKFELGDGTKVWLNHGSKLKYPYRFEGKDRRVFLTGEAYFEVAHNKDIPFIVGTNRLDIKATGTAFNVSVYPDDDMVETTLIEGKVVLYKSNSNNEIKDLSPNECLTFNSLKDSYTVKTDNTAKNISWKDGLLVFRNDPIENVVKKLARWYNVDVEISDERAKEYSITATFSNETLLQVIDLMTLPTPLSYKLTPSIKLPDGSYSKQKIVIGFKNITKH